MTKNTTTDKSQAGPVLRPESFIELSKITQDDDKFRCRVADDEERIEKLTELLTEYNAEKKDGKNPSYPFRPIVVWQNGTTYTLIAGYHRFGAAHKAKSDTILAMIFEGTQEQAVWFAMKDNSTHGLRLNGNDLKLCITKALRLFSDKSPAVIAQEIGCSRSYAYKIETELSTSGQLEKAEARQGADGKVRAVKKKAKPARKAVSDGKKGTSRYSKAPSAGVMKNMHKAITYLTNFAQRFSDREDRIYICDIVTDWANEEISRLSIKKKKKAALPPKK